MRRLTVKLALVATTALCSASPALAQAAGGETGDIIVTARRSEERLQDVPISITVLSQDALAKRNIVSASELGQYVPSLSTQQQFGSEKSSFVLRGFTQEGKTSPSVGVYFADVIAPRAFGGTTSGNGAGVGSMFDLQNVQVLKGPQGTLFGRNTTGGAILLVPQKPTDKLEGYVEGSAGSYDLRRVQAALNAPLSDTFRVRAGFDWNKRDGYIKNHGVGPADFNNTNYFAARLSMVADLTPDLENYTIFSYSKSNTNGNVPRIMACTDAQGNPPNGAIAPLAAALNPFACDQVARANARGDGFWSADNNNANPYMRIKQWQAINTTTWQVNDSLTVKNIISYAEFKEAASFDLLGDNFLFPNNPSIYGPLAGQPFTKSIELNPGFSGYLTSQSTFTEELQIRGTTADDRLDWQAGVYFELSKPLNFNSGLTGIFINCTDIKAFNCTNPLGFGSISAANVKDTFNNKGLYAQASYKLTDQLSLTGGIRYTVDKMIDVAQNLSIQVPTPGTAIFACQNRLVYSGATLFDPKIVNSPAECEVRIARTWKRPTWLIGVDFKPNEDTLLYAKWARGYRQGAINSNNLGLEVAGPEKVDTYEIGGKASFGGAVPGYFNVSAFYNDFRDQQLAVNSVVAIAFQGIVPASQPIVNAGKSRIWGIEADASISPFRGLKLDVGYAYLNTKLQSFTPPPPPVYYALLLPTAQEGESLALSPKNRITVSATYTLPFDQSIGEISFGAIFTHTDANRAVSPAASPNFFMLKKSDLLNLNANWDSMFGAPVDMSFFMTNVTNEKRIAYPTTSLLTFGGEGGHLNQPRMWGFRLKYRFGQ